MMLCAFEILLKNGRKTGGNCSSMNLSSVVSHTWAVKHELSSATGHAWVVTHERPCRYKSTNLVTTINGANARYMVRESEENKINVVMAILLCAERNDSIIKSQLEAASL